MQRRHKQIYRREWTKKNKKEFNAIRGRSRLHSFNVRSVRVGAFDCMYRGQSEPECATETLYVNTKATTHRPHTVHIYWIALQCPQTTTQRNRTRWTDLLTLCSSPPFIFFFFYIISSLYCVRISSCIVRLTGGPHVFLEYYMCLFTQKCMFSFQRWAL